MATPSLDDWDKVLLGESSDKTSTTSGYAAPQAPPGPDANPVDWDSILLSPQETAETLQPNPIKRFAAGMGRGAVDVQQTISKLGLEGLTHLGYPKIASDYYNNKINRERKLYESTHPDSWMGTGRVVGQGLTELPLFMVGGEAAAPVVEATGIPGAVASTSGAPNLLLRAAGRSLTGATMGGMAAGLTSAGYNRPAWQQVKQGAEAGALVNPLAPLVGAPLKYAGRVVKNMADPITTNLSRGLMRRAVANRLVSAAVRDGINPDEIATVMATMGPEATPVDAVSKLMGIRQGGNVRNLGEMVANNPGEGSAIANKVLQERMDNMPDAINQDVMNLTGQKGDVFHTIEDQLARRSQAAGPLYQEALAKDVTPDEELIRLLGNPNFKTGLQRGVNIARNEADATGAPFDESLYSIEGKSPESAVHLIPGEAEDVWGGGGDPVSYAIQGKNGEDLGAIDGYLSQDGKTFHVNDMWGPFGPNASHEEQANALGTKAMRDVMRAIKGQHPSIEKISGLRTTGAHGEPTEVTVKAPQAAKPKISMKALHAAKTGLDDILDQYRDKNTGRLNLDNEGVSIDKLRRSYLSKLDTLNPQYAEARAAYAGPSQSIDRINEGMDIFKKRVTPEGIEHSVAKMSPSDHEFYLTGVTRALQDALESGPDGANAVRRVFRTPAQRAKIKAAIGDEAKYEAFKKQMENKAIMAETRNQVLSNSATVRRQNAPAALSDIMEPVGHLMAGRPLGAIGSAARTVNNYLMTPSRDQLGMMGNLLFSQDPAFVENALNRVRPGPIRQLWNGLTGTAAYGKLPFITLGYQENQGR